MPTNLGRLAYQTRTRPIAAAFVLSLALGWGCAGPRAVGSERLQPEYDQKTGKLRLLKYDSNGDGKVDTWSYMDGLRIVRIEIDKDGDGKIDRWEYYRPDRTLEKVGFSRANDGKEDAWSFAGPDGSVVRIDVSTHRDGRVDRIEHYERDVLVRAEEDTDGDGTLDKWETYEQSRLASVSYDSTRHRGAPDRRMTYEADGSARMEVIGPREDRAATKARTGPGK
jgi:hypothetical protein